MPAKLSSEPVLYPRVDWFDHGQNESQEEDKNDKQKSAKEYVLHCTQKNTFFIVS